MNFFFAILNDRVLMWNRIKYLNDGVLHSIKAPAFNQANFTIAETEELKQKRKWNLSRPIQINRGNGIPRKRKSHKWRRECI